MHSLGLWKSQSERESWPRSPLSTHPRKRHAETRAQFFSREREYSLTLPPRCLARRLEALFTAPPPNTCLGSHPSTAATTRDAERQDN
jgi:hypothetical protein